MDGDAPIGDQQEQAPPANIPMTVSFRDANGSAVDFKMKPTTKLGKAMTAFSNKVGRDAMQLRFLFEGQRVVDDDTPTTLEMQEGDTIEVHMEQIGGGSATTADDAEDDEWIVVDFEGEDRISERTESEVARCRATPSNTKTAKQAGESLLLVIADKAGNSVHYKVRPSARLKKAFRHFAQARGLNEDKLRFYYEGEKLNGHERAVFLKVGNHATVTAEQVEEF